jgi:hypothetical protein
MMLKEYSAETLRHAQKNEVVDHAIMEPVAPMGKIVSLLSFSPSRRATEETLLLLEKLKVFWDAIEASLVKIGAGESLH